jgi:hypothetical protein
MSRGWATMPTHWHRLQNNLLRALKKIYYPHHNIRNNLSDLGRVKPEAKSPPLGQPLSMYRLGHFLSKTGARAPTHHRSDSHPLR